MSQIQRPKKSRVINKPYVKWSYEERINLIKTRISNDDRFTSKTANPNEAWKIVSSVFDSTKSPLLCKQQWNQLLKKYKELTKDHTGDGAGDFAPIDAEDWPYYELIHGYASKKDNYRPPFLISSAIGTHSMTLDNDHGNSESSQDITTSPVSLPNRNENNSPVASTPNTTHSSRSRTPGTKRFTDFEKYSAKRDKKMSRNISSLMAVFGHIVSQEYPTININHLVVSSSTDDSE